MLLLDFLYHALTSLTASKKQPKNLTPPHTPPPTSRKRQDSMNSAKMNANNVHVVQEIPSARGAGVLNSNTGFPEPLSADRNTTLPHPDADTSKNATIEAGDLELTRSKEKRRFLHSRHHSHKSVTSGKIDPADSGLYDNIQYADGTKEKHAGARVAAQQNGHVVAHADHHVVKEGEEFSEDEVLRAQKETDEQGYADGERRKGILRKLHLHKV